MANQEKQATRPPVVVILGHVDHGKTSILDYIRKTKVAEKESGGITQHIGAYQAKKDGKIITFIDTPGHEAFSAMRSRGAKIADIAILVIDAAEGIKNQTKEAIEAIEKAGIPVIVALNKIDKAQCQPEFVMGELKKYGLTTEQMAGKTPAVKTSAKTGQGIDELLETILLLAEMEELKTDTSLPAEGVVIESSLDAKKGPLATLLVDKGVLKEGDFIGVASVSGKIKNMIDFQGKGIKQAFPSQPVQVLGFNQAPQVGEKFKVFSDLAEVEKAALAGTKQILSKPAVKKTEEKKKVLRIILKADFLGSLEAVESVLKAIAQEEVALEVIKAEAGNIGISDVQLAENVKAKIIGFRVKIDETTRRLAQQKKIVYKIFEVIYELVEEVRAMMEKMFVPEKQRIDLGKIKIIALFKKDKKGQIIGGRVIEGEIKKDVSVEVFREDELIGRGRIKGLEQEKKEVALVGKGKEVGMWFDGDVEIQENDILLVFKEEKQKKE